MSSVIRSLSESTGSTPVRLACAALITGLLAGCSAMDGVLSSDRVDYRGAAKQTTGLDVPPDLTQLSRENRSPVQGGSVSASQLLQAANAAPAANNPALVNNVAVQAVGQVKLMREGDQRWLSSALAPEQLWPQLRSFWQERGFELPLDDAAVGVMETNWLENRAKLPQDIVRQTVGRVLDGLYSTGERDKYRTRVERNAQGGTDIYIAHRGVQEVYTGAQRDQTGWQARPSDPALEAEMLSRLMLKLGAKEEEAKAVLAQQAATPARQDSKFSQPAVPQSQAATRPLSEVPNALQVNEGFERAWRRVGQSLDRHGFTIEDRDRKQGLFFLRYADPNMVGKEEPGFFSKLFGGDKGVVASRYRVSVKSEGERSTITILDDKGQQQTNEIAKRILNLLMDDLR